MENEYCNCNELPEIYTVNGEFGYCEHCASCDKKLEDGFHFYDEPEIY